MNLGEKIKNARISKKITQSALAGDKITRNMLSQIENGKATPSLETLSYIAGELNLPIAYFFSENDDEYFYEKKALINDIYGAAYDVRDFRTMQFLDWFVKEQGEEETNANDLITKMELFGSDPRGLYLLNQELLARVYTAPSLVL